MATGVATAIRAAGLDKGRARRIERQSRRADVLPLRAETAFLRREASLALPGLHRLLADDADFDAIVWSLKPDRVEELARTLEWLYEVLPDEFTFEAIPPGRAPTEKRVSRAELLRIVRAGRLETRTRYRVPAGAARPT